MTDDKGNARKDEDGHDIEVYLWSQEEAITINTAQDAEGTATMSATDGVFEAKTKVEYTIQVDVVNGDETITSGNSATVTYALDSTKYESDLDSVILLGSNGRKIVLLKDGAKTNLGEVVITEMGNGVVKFLVPSFGTVGTPTVITVRIKTRLSLKRRSLLEYVFGRRSLVGDTRMGSGGAPLTVTNDGKGAPAPCDGYIEDCKDLASVASVNHHPHANGGAPVVVGGLAVFAAVVSGAATL